VYLQNIMLTNKKIWRRG